MTREALKALLEREASKRNTLDELSYARPDPLLVASRYQDERIALVCALFGYGNAKLIVQFLESLDFSCLDASEEKIRKCFAKHYYRFQKSEDVIALFLALRRLHHHTSIEEIVYTGYRRENNILDGLWALIERLNALCPHESYGYRFLIGSRPKKLAAAGTYKRYMMYFRWMVRRDSLDMGLWSKIDTKDLIIPLDTHTFQVSRRLGLLQRKSYDMKAALALTEELKRFDPKDPVRFDFALYRLGQEKLIQISSH
jgi:uncharacterized protein (TIGR02757 family)